MANKQWAGCALRGGTLRLRGGTLRLRGGTLRLRLGWRRRAVPFVPRRIQENDGRFRGVKQHILTVLLGFD